MNKLMKLTVGIAVTAALVFAAGCEPVNRPCLTIDYKSDASCKTSHRCSANVCRNFSAN